MVRSTRRELASQQPSPPDVAQDHSVSLDSFVDAATSDAKLEKSSDERIEPLLLVFLRVRAEILDAWRPVVNRVEKPPNRHYGTGRYAQICK